METIAGHVRALREGDDAAKAAAARVLGTQALYNESNKVLIVEAGGIPPLVDLLRDGNAEAKAEVARALCNLAYVNAANKVLIAEAGAIPLLVELLRDGDVWAKAQAARALVSLALNNGNKVLIAEAGAVPPLVQLLRDGSEEGKEQARILLGRIAYTDHDNRVLIAEAGGIPPIVELLHVRAQPRSADLDDVDIAWHWAAPVLGRLAYGNPNTQALITEAGGIPPLVQLLRDGSADSEDVKRTATWALRSLAHNNDTNAVAIALTVGFHTVVELARRGRVTVGALVLANASVPAKRKAALVVAALLGDCVPDSARARVPYDVNAAIVSFL